MSTHMLFKICDLQTLAVERDAMFLLNSDSVYVDTQQINYRCFMLIFLCEGLRLEGSIGLAHQEIKLNGGGPFDPYFLSVFNDVSGH